MRQRRIEEIILPVVSKLTLPQVLIGGQPLD
jgi:hypothetical protein